MSELVIKDKIIKNRLSEEEFNLIKDSCKILGIWKAKSEDTNMDYIHVIYGK